MTAALIALTATWVQADPASLPLEPGVYVADGSRCAGAPSSAESSFHGGYVIQFPHAVCRAKSVIRRGANSFVVSLRCYENGDPTLAYRLVDQITIVSPTRYEMTNRFGRFDAHRCPF